MNQTSAKHARLRVLNLEDNPNDSELIQAELENAWDEVELLRVESRDAFVRALDEFRPDVVLSDFNLPDMNGRDALRFVRHRHPDIPVVMVTGALGDVEAVELVKLGARDYVMKDHLQRLTPAVQSALSQERGIRARKEAEQALRQSEEEIRALVEHSPVATVVSVGSGEDERIVMMNRRFTELFGYTLEDIPDLRRWWLQAYPDERYRAQLQADWAEVAERAARNHGLVEPKEVSATCKDGTVRYVRISVVSAGGRNIVTFEDMTEHRRAEAHIQRLNQLYAVLSECNQAIVRSADEAELLARVCAAITGFGSFRMAWVGMVDTATRMVVPVASCGEGAQEYLRDIKISAEADSEFGRGPTGIAIREDQPFWCEDFLGSPATAPWHERAKPLGWRSSAALPLHRGGEVVGTLTMYAVEPYVFDKDVRDLLLEMAADIDYSLDYFSHEAERKRAEAELRKLSQAVEQSPSSIVITDLDARLEYVNEAFVRATGYSREEAIGQNPRMLHSGKTPKSVYDDMWAHLTRGDNWRGEFVNRRKDGGEYIESILVSPIRDADGMVSHYLGIKEDISERKRMEQQVVAQLEHLTSVNAQLLEANRQLEQARSQLLQSEKMAAIGLLAAGVAHEINNPVGYVNSNLGTLEKYLADLFVVLDKYEAAEALPENDGQLLEELRQFKKRIDLNFLREDIKALLAESHQGLERIKKIILDLKDFSRSDADEQWAWADVHHGLDSTLNVVWNELKYKCEVVKEYGELPNIWCLPSQLNQVFMNLLVNAAQAIEVRGTITIRTGAEGERVWVEVVDTGKGIPPENIPRLFDPFFTTKPAGKGTGLGLSVSYKIVEKHHGRIEVRSEPGKGSSFRVWLPVRPVGGEAAG